MQTKLTRTSVICAGSRGEEAPYAIMVFVHGESYEWGGGHVYDVSVWASQCHVIAVTLNYRLGPLGKYVFIYI